MNKGFVELKKEEQMEVEGGMLEPGWWHWLKKLIKKAFPPTFYV